jgi:hypothetical protein
MRPIAPEELRRRASSYAAMLQDRCIIMRFASGYAPDATETPCNFRMAATAAGTTGDVFLASGAQTPGMTVTMAPSALLAPGDRIRMTARRGQALDVPIDYLQVDAPETDAIATIVRIRKKTP